MHAPVHAKPEGDIITSAHGTVATELLTAERAVRAGNRISVLCIVAVQSTCPYRPAKFHLCGRGICIWIRVSPKVQTSPEAYVCEVVFTAGIVTIKRTKATVSRSVLPLKEA